MNKKLTVIVAYIMLAVTLSGCRVPLKTINAINKKNEDTVLAAVKKNNKWGYIDEKGTEVIPCKYEYVANFAEGVLAVQLNGKWGAFDKQGNNIKIGRAHV